MDFEPKELIIYFITVTVTDGGRDGHGQRWKMKDLLYGTVRYGEVRWDKFGRNTVLIIVVEKF